MNPILLTSILGVMILGVVGCKQDAGLAQPPMSKPDKPQMIQSKPMDGAYLIIKSSATRECLMPIPDGQTVLEYDHKYNEPDLREPPLYLAVRNLPDVPLWLESPPRVGREDASGKTLIQLRLNPDAANLLQRFTTEYQGSDAAVAMIIGGEVVTTHKIRAAIKDGQLQVVCCSKGACEYLVRQIQANTPLQNATPSNTEPNPIR